MRRPTSVPLDRVKFPLTLADGLRTTFADVVAIPLPAPLAALTRRLDVLGEEPDHGASATDTRRCINRRG
jgi:hypothetical protein